LPCGFSLALGGLQAEAIGVYFENKEPPSGFLIFFDTVSILGFEAKNAARLIHRGETHAC
jgi:hypothetical protein